MAMMVPKGRPTNPRSQYDSKDISEFLVIGKYLLWFLLNQTQKGVVFCWTSQFQLNESF
jgi:hypothetical protein